MGSTTVALSIFLTCYLVFGSEIPDVTTVYEIRKTILTDRYFQGFERINSADSGFPPIGHASPETETYCVNAGRVHSRTNAIGLGVINENIELLDPHLFGIPNITCDANFFNQTSCNVWDFKDGIYWTSYYNDFLLPGQTLTNGKTYAVSKQANFTFNIHALNETDIIFISGKESLIHLKNVFVVRFSSQIIDIYYSCTKRSDYDYHYSYHYKPYMLNIMVSELHGNREFGCDSKTQLEVSQNHRFITFDFTSNQYIYIYTGDGYKNSQVFSRDLQTIYGTADKINYFLISTVHVMDINSIKYLEYPKGLYSTKHVMVSPVFTPKSETLCVVIFFHCPTSSDECRSSSLNIFVEGFLLDDTYLLDLVTDIENGWNTRVINSTLRSLNPIKLSIKPLGNLTFARIASCNPDDVIKPVTNSTNNCWNGGKLTTAGCACTPGFSGTNCEIGCGRNRFGRDCEGFCSYHDQECRGLLLCNNFTGCQCAPGYQGPDCTQACTLGWYGNDCSQQCGHCGDGHCDIYTGYCVSCEEGYLAPYCKTASVYYGAIPTVTSPSYNTIVVSFDPDNYISQGEPPQLYQIQYREKGNQWKVHTSKAILKSGEPSDKENIISENIEGLKAGIFYQVRVLLIDAYLQKYQGNLIKIAEVQTKCHIPSIYNYSLAAVTNTTTITISWSYNAEDENWCPVETYEVTWKEGWKRQVAFTKENHFTLSHLVPGLKIKYQVRAKTRNGFAPYSPTMMTSAVQAVVPPVRNLHVESSQSSSVDLSWDPPIGSGERKLLYTILYECVDRPACSPGCQNVSEGQLTQDGTSITLSPLLPFTKYKVTVRASGGADSSIFVGTTRVVPTEAPSVSVGTRRPLRTNTSVTVFWDQTSVCTGYLLGYNYQLTKESEGLKILASGFTKDTNVSFHNLTASSEYTVKVFVHTVAGWNPLSFLAIHINTSATVPEAVRNLTIYKRGRGMLGLRWAEPKAIYGQLKSFTVTHSLGPDVQSHIVEPVHCVVWPDLYCHTLEELKSNKLYTVTVSARNLEVLEDGEPATVAGITKESTPMAPVNLTLINSTSTSLVVQWGHPELANGILRSFLVSIEETEKYDQDSCCQVYPLVETSVKEETQKYEAEVSGLHPASTYYVSVNAKTVGLGPSQSLVASTAPPNLPLTILPSVVVPTADQTPFAVGTSSENSWLPQDKLQEVNNSQIYTPLIKTHLILAVLSNSSSITPSESGISDPKLDSLLRQKIGKPFYFTNEFTQDEEEEIFLTFDVPNDIESTWGYPVPLPRPAEYKIAATQVLEYNGAYNVDIRYSPTFWFD
ncbi:tenascin-like isoform X2 [Macrosteles quadrilineatus]|uniref:tenascin-like isoform X2 n=1 Tax=Macrosteles quadrilineatus TaxID=74068 RepID=UPI0023E1897A|nr:tenascin-like isoform X2 [Macrosteles quadrilineatus]